MHGRDRGWGADGDPQCRRRTDDPVRRRVHEGRSAAGRCAREAPAGDEPREHDLLDQALHGPEVRRGLGGDEDRPLRGRQGARRRRARQGRRQGVRAAGDQRDDPAEAEGRRGGLPRRAGRRTRSSPSPPTSTTRSARRRRTPARSPGSTCSASSTSRPRPRSRTTSTRSRTRRSSSSTSAAARSTCRCSSSTGAHDARGARDERRQPPRRRQLGQGARRLDGGRVQARPGHRPVAGPDGAPAAVRGRGEGEDRALLDDDDADQPAVRHRHAGGPEAPRPPAHAGEAERVDG